jgi:3-oxoacyl-[acyl-carrier protein] reductase
MTVFGSSIQIGLRPTGIALPANPTECYRGTFSQTLRRECSRFTFSNPGVDTITKSLAKELGPRKIRVNAINPGMVETEGLHAGGFVGSDFQKLFETQSALGRIGQPDDVAPAVVFLASPDASWITGETLVVSGGYR